MYVQPHILFISLTEIFSIGPVKTQPSKKRAQTTRKVNDGQFGGVTSAAKNSSPAVHSKASTPRQGGKKLQSDRPDLLPSESPRPWSNGNDSQDEQPDVRIV